MVFGPEREPEREDIEFPQAKLPLGDDFDLIHLPEAVREQLVSLLCVTAEVVRDIKDGDSLLGFWPAAKYERSFDQFQNDMEAQLGADRLTRELLELLVEVQEFFGLAIVTSLSEHLNRFYNRHILPSRAPLFSDKARDLFHETRMALQYFRFCRLDLGQALDDAESGSGALRLDSSSAFCLREALTLAAPELDESWHNPLSDNHEFQLPEVEQWEQSEGGPIERALADLECDRLPDAVARLITDEAIALDAALLAAFEERLDGLSALGDDLSDLGRLPRKVEQRLEKFLDDADDLLGLFHLVYEELPHLLSNSG